MKKLKNEELGRKSIVDFKKTKKNPIIIVLDNVRSIYNVGSIFRTCDAFLIESIYLCGITATPKNRDLHKTALGAEDSLDWKYFSNPLTAISNLVEGNYQIISIEQTIGSIALHDFAFEKNQNYALVFGNEIKGVQQNIVDKSHYCIEIPQFGTKHSFNISISTGIVLWEILKQISFK